MAAQAANMPCVLQEILELARPKKSRGNLPKAARQSKPDADAP
jgi:hypothetical protein